MVKVSPTSGRIEYRGRRISDDLYAYKKRIGRFETGRRERLMGVPLLGAQKSKHPPGEQKEHEERSEKEKSFSHRLLFGRHMLYRPRPA